MNNLRILQVVPVFSQYFGGAVNVVKNISRELAKTNDVTVFTTTRCDQENDLEPKEELIDGYRVRYFRRNARKFFGELNISFDFMKAVQKNLKDFDVVHLHSWRQFEDLIIFKYALKNGVPFVLHAHGTLAKVNMRIIKMIHELAWGRKLLRNASRVIAISPKEAQQFLSLGVPYNKINIVYNGLDLEKYSVLPVYGSFRNKYSINKDCKIILYLGRIDSTKGIDFLIEAFAYSAKKLALDNVLLAICGPDFGYSSQVNALVKRYELTDKVMLSGMLSEEEKVMAYVDANLVVYPEKFNVWALVAMEAAACGTPVIVSNSNYIANVVDSGKFGFTIKYGDFKSLGKLLKAVLDDEDTLLNMGLKGRQFVFEKFGWKNSVSKLEKIYSEVAINKAKWS